MLVLSSITVGISVTSGTGFVQYLSPIIIAVDVVVQIKQTFFISPALKRSLELQNK